MLSVMPAANIHCGLQSILVQLCFAVMVLVLLLVFLCSGETHRVITCVSGALNVRINCSGPDGLTAHVSSSVSLCCSDTAACSG